MAIIGYGGYEFIPWESLKAADLAAWVQAVGSIVAVGAAGGIAVYQNRMMRRNAVEDRALEIAQRQKSIYAIAVAAAELVEDVEMSFLENRSDDYFALRYRPRAFQHAETALKAIPLHDLSSYSLVTGILKLAAAVSSAAEFCDAFNEEDGDTAEMCSYAVNDFGLLAQEGFQYVQRAVDRAHYVQTHGRYPDGEVAEGWYGEKVETSDYGGE
jgi:hypothetical protein